MIEATVISVGPDEGDDEEVFEAEIVDEIPPDEIPPDEIPDNETFIDGTPFVEPSLNETPPPTNPKKAIWESDLKKARRQLKTLKNEQASFNAWVNEIRSTILGGLLFTEYDREQELRKRLAQLAQDDDLLGEQSVIAPKPPDAKWWQRALIRWGSATAPITVLGTVMAANGEALAEFVNAHILIPTETPITANILEGFAHNAPWLLPLSGIVSLAPVGWAYWQALKRSRPQVTEAPMLPDMAGYYRYESARLEQLIQPLRDWVTTIGWILHYPHGPVSHLSHPVDQELVASLPASFGIAEAVPSANTPKRLIAQTVDVLYPKGWASTLFDHSYAEFAKESTYSESGPMLAADLDDPDSVSGPREELMTFWSSGQPSDFHSQQGILAIKKAVHNGRMDRLATRNVTRLGRHSDRSIIPEPEFFSAVAAPATVFPLDMLTDLGVSGKQAVSRSIVWLPTGVLPADASPGTQVKTSGPSLAYRVDVSRPLLPAEVAIFGNSRATSDSDDATFDDGSTGFIN